MAEKTKVRVLLDGEHGKINDVVTLDAAEAKSAVEAGWADATPAAVAYAEKIQKRIADAAEAAISD